MTLSLMMSYTTNAKAPFNMLICWRYLFIKPGFEPGLEPGLELGLEPGLDSALEPKMTSGDFDEWKFIDSALTFKEFL